MIDQNSPHTLAAPCRSKGPAMTDKELPLADMGPLPPPTTPATQALLPVTPELLARMSNQISEWEMDEPRSDWWQYQRDFADAHLILQNIQSDQIIEGIASDIAAGLTESQAHSLPRDVDIRVAISEAIDDFTPGMLHSEKIDLVWCAISAALTPSALSGGEGK